MRAIRDDDIHQNLPSCYKLTPFDSAAWPRSVAKSLAGLAVAVVVAVAAGLRPLLLQLLPPRLQTFGYSWHPFSRLVSPWVDR